MLEKLTPEQEAMIDVVRDEWIARGLSTGRCDRKAIEAAAMECYRIAGLEAPKAIYWEDSPYAGAVKAAKLIAETDEMPTKEQIQAQLSACGYGSQDSGWLSYYDFFRRCGVDVSQLNGLFAMADAGWWWPMEKAMVLTERPKEIHMDERGDLHNESGPAISYFDGTCYWLIHGHAVTEKIVMRPHEITVDEIRNEANAETQRIMIERMGPGEYLAACKAKVLDMDSLTLEGSAPRALMEDDLGNKWLVGTDGSTARVYTMSVPNEARTCREAHLMISGLDKEDRTIAEG